MPKDMQSAYWQYLVKYDQNEQLILLDQQKTDTHTLTSRANATTCQKRGVHNQQLYQAMIQDGHADKELPRFKIGEQWTSMTGINKKDSLILLKTTSSQIATIHSVNQMSGQQPSHQKGDNQHSLSTS